jgi:4-carboxymuconolactone decarboxylase
MTVSKHLFLVLLLLVATQIPHYAQRGNAPRIRPLEPSEWTDVHREVLGARANGRVLNAIRTYIQHPELYRSFTAFSRYIEGPTSLSARDKELIVLRTVWRTRDEYSWAYHVPAARRAGLSEDEVARIPKGPDAAGWSAFDAALLRSADELHATQRISDATWKTLAERYNEKQLMDLIFTVGHRTVASMFHNSAGVELEQGIAGFPK